MTKYVQLPFSVKLIYLHGRNYEYVYTFEVAQAKTTKYYSTKYTVNVFQGFFGFNYYIA